MEALIAQTVPDSDYFITADAGYCHILPEHIIITTHVVYNELPPARDKKNNLALVFGSVGVAFGTFLMINFFRVGFYLMGTMFFLAMFYATKALADVARYSTTNNIERKQIETLEIKKPFFGYLYLLVRFRNSAGKTSLRKIKLYDSDQNERHAVQLLKKAGWGKS
jgi:hypothetical protein